MVKIIWSEEDEREIINLYTKEGLSMEDIKKKFNCSSSTIKRVLEENNIRIKSMSELKKGIPNPKCSETKKRLFKEGKLISPNKIIWSEEDQKKIIDLYLNEKLNLKEIGKIFNCSLGPIKKLLKENDVKMRTLSESMKGNTPWNKDLTKEDPRVAKYALSEGSKKTQFKKGQEPGIKNKTYEEYYGEERGKELREKDSLGHMGKIPWNKDKPFMAGDKNPNWQNGISFLPYSSKFNNRFKRKIRKRDNHICMLCGTHQEKLSRTLTIHHINYSKILSIPQNCISLCNRCNILVNYNRDKWTVFFQSLLSEKYNYKYSEDQKIVLDFIK